MKSIYGAINEYLIHSLNTDILYEAGMADDCIQRAGSLAQPYYRLHRQIALCAASALENATKLAAEVLSLGGNPAIPALQQRGRTRGPKSIEEYLAHARAALMHYQRRLAMAERFGLPRLREVFRGIVLSKARHLSHAGLVAAAAVRPRQLS